MSKLQLSVLDFERQIQNNYRIIDIRKPEFFAYSHIPLSLNLVFDDSFSKHAKKFLFKDEAIIIVGESGQEEDAILEIEKLGYQNIRGYLDGGIDAWIEAKKNIDVVISIMADELAIEVKHAGLYVYDLRLKSAFDRGHIQESENIKPALFITDYSAIEEDEFSAIVCEDGRLSMSMISYLKINGKHNLYHAEGGFAEIKKEERFELVKTGSVNQTLSGYNFL
ncbi:MAG: rhodanese-like domain-containing protein [Bacteroidetes bacterium]|nr:rhodanese-like domain-containing protein [Bacteroidota bacterium]